ncbi:uncharacterized protein LOC124926459 [Impatiens glandulifera]|uniref:uncharacterized protein LOC124926459 n=1 Tax=Impatiens glandulifera TaxID=253017 RepID=UPI001FB1230D|nr:uncharacterized protein LOC124926459 [Impatiens glandulifera]
MRQIFVEPKYSQKCIKIQGNGRKYTKDGGATYCGGSIPTIEHQRRLTEELGRPATIYETFEKTFKKKDGTWSGKRIVEVVNSFTQLNQTQESMDMNEKKSEMELWMEAAGKSKSDCVFGIGYMGRKQVFQNGQISTQLSLEVNTLKETVSALQMQNSEKDKENAIHKEEYTQQQERIKLLESSQVELVQDKVHLQNDVKSLDEKNG